MLPAVSSMHPATLGQRTALQTQGGGAGRATCTAATSTAWLPATTGFSVTGLAGAWLKAVSGALSTARACTRQPHMAQPPGLQLPVAQGRLARWGGDITIVLSGEMVPATPSNNTGACAAQPRWCRPS